MNYRAAWMVSSPRLKCSVSAYRSPGAKETNQIPHESKDSFNSSPKSLSHLCPSFHDCKNSLVQKTSGCKPSRTRWSCSDRLNVLRFHGVSHWPAHVSDGWDYYWIGETLARSHSIHCSSFWESVCHKQPVHVNALLWCQRTALAWAAVFMEISRSLFLDSLTNRVFTYCWLAISGHQNHCFSQIQLLEISVSSFFVCLFVFWTFLMIF